jgi:uncharacterized membrane protein
VNAWRHFLTAIGVLLVTHALTVWALPRVIMWRVMTVASAETSVAGTFLPPPTDHTARRIVMPSPDLLYATCSFSLRDGPVRVSFDGHYPRYWSIALYADNSDNFFVTGDRNATDQPRQWLVSTANQAASAVDRVAERRITAPSDRVFLLMRLLVNDDPTVLADAERARHSLRCTRTAES